MIKKAKEASYISVSEYHVKKLLIKSFTQFKNYAKFMKKSSQKINVFSHRKE